VPPAIGRGHLSLQQLVIRLWPRTEETWLGVRWSRRIIGCPAENRRGCEGLNGFDFAHRIKGSVPVQARDHRKRRCNHISAVSTQRDYALAA